MADSMRSTAIARSLRAGFIVLLAACTPSAEPEGGDDGDSDHGLPTADFEELERAVAERVARTRVLVLNFWASWCGPCMTEMPELAEVSRSYADRGVELVGIALDKITANGKYMTPARMADLIERRDIEIPVIYYEGDGESLVRRFDLPAGIPFTVVLDDDGEVVRTFPGAVDRRTLGAAIDSALSP